MAGQTRALMAETAALVKAWLESEWGRIMPVVSTSFAVGDTVQENPPPAPVLPIMTVVSLGVGGLLGLATHATVECEWLDESGRHTSWFDPADIHLVPKK
jgi:uncharacterized protein YodC (DUF2158 family)